ncbi:MAG: AAA family ATPase [Candidatus Micrarchaeia archaeon]
MIICITGMPGSGKSVTADILGKMGFKIIEMGDLIREEMKRNGIKVTNENMRNFAIDIRKRGGNDIVAKLTAKKIKNLRNRGKIAIVGVRNADELSYFRRIFKRFATVEIYAPAKSRYERLEGRGRKDDPKNYNEFKFREKKEGKLGIASAIMSTDYVVLNTGSIADLKKSLKLLVGFLEEKEGNAKRKKSVPGA